LKGYNDQLDFLNLCSAHLHILLLSFTWVCCLRAVKLSCIKQTIWNRLPSHQTMKREIKNERRLYVNVLFINLINGNITDKQNQSSTWFVQKKSKT
jgi:hypothetical protein